MGNEETARDSLSRRIRIDKTRISLPAANLEDKAVMAP